MYAAAPAWFVICGEAGPLGDGWRCLFEPTFHPGLLVVVERIPGLTLLRVHRPPDAQDLFWERVPLGGTAFLFPGPDDVEPRPHDILEVEIPEASLPEIRELEPLPDEGIRDGMIVTTQVWHASGCTTIAANPPTGEHLALVTALLDLAERIEDSEIRRRIAAIRRYLR